MLLCMIRYLKCWKIILSVFFALLTLLCWSGLSRENSVTTSRPSSAMSGGGPRAGAQAQGCTLLLLYLLVIDVKWLFLLFTLLSYIISIVGTVCFFFYEDKVFVHMSHLKLPFIKCSDQTRILRYVWII